MDLRSNKMLKAYNIDAYKTYPAMRIIPELRRNGFKGAFHELTPYEFFTAILTDSKKETLLKAGQTEMFRYAVISNICKTAPTFRERHPLPKICLSDRLEKGT